MSTFYSVDASNRGRISNLSPLELTDFRHHVEPERAGARTIKSRAQPSRRPERSTTRPDSEVGMLPPPRLSLECPATRLHPRKWFVNDVVSTPALPAARAHDDVLALGHAVGQRPTGDAKLRT